ncbi:hypothetical protein INT44_008599 [Umbelopsis vinacea]|uniref:PIN domain-containing protein n=1 Tax=Umbelopsis vinacea TaxID=44442 RepID=A0A8H7PW93_9FUNG|nr:hypothetical protein INT44_008599 [Umbelopsis vinacea]
MVDEPHRPNPRSDLRTLKTLTDKAKEAHKRAVKSAFKNIQAVENEIAQIASSARLLALNEQNGDFRDSDSPFNSRNRDTGNASSSSPRRSNRQDRAPGISDIDLSTKKDVWEQKIQLHIRLANRYLDLIKLDYAFSEKKSLESLCWKRAIYSLVDQFRQALKVCAKRGRARKEEHSDTSMLIEVDSDEDDISAISNSTKGRSGVSSDIDSAREEYIMMKLLFNDFLIQADDFYEQLMEAVFELESKDSRATYDVAPSWTGHKRRKWFKSVPNRGDLARYRWSFTTDSSADYDIATKFRIANNKPINREDARRIAWKWYTLASWLMPNAGKPFFNLALLMHGQNSLEACHKLYLNICSLIVRRNPFMNGREGILALLEENRRWVTEYTKSTQATDHRRHKAQREMQANQSNKQNNPNNDSSEALDKKSKSDHLIISLFIRLHGMMFTKIGLDQFKEIRRRFFESLFPNNRVALLQYSSPPSERKGLSGTEQFWMELAITNLASIYHYNYPTSRLGKLTCEAFKILFDSQSRTTNDDENLRISQEINLPESNDMKRTASVAESPDEMVHLLQDDEIFSHGIDLSIQVAVEMLSRYNADHEMNIATPLLPPFPVTVVSFASHEKNPWWIDAITPRPESGRHQESWLVYIHVIMQWLTLSFVFHRSDHSGGCRQSFWERIVGPICLLEGIGSRQHGKSVSKHANNKVSEAFWTLLVQFLNKLLSEIPTEMKLTLIDIFIVRATADIEENDETARLTYLLQSAMTLPVLPEEATLKGLGWVEDAINRVSKSMPAIEVLNHFNTIMPNDIGLQRKIRIICYAFVLHQQMKEVFEFDSVEEIFSIVHSSVIDDDLNTATKQTGQLTIEQEARNTQDETNQAPILQQESNHPLSESEDDAEENSIIRQLKERRKQLEQDLLKASPSIPNIYPRKAKKDEKKEKMNELREQVVPGATPLVIDTNCFIGELANVKKVIQCAKWQIIIPLVVITELDGLRTNHSALGTNAKEALAYLEQIFSQNKSLATRQAHVRIQTSHNNFLHDISMRSEQFMWGETDRNLDDLILSVCVWWAGQSTTETQPGARKVCLVTSDRNLSIKARARDIKVADISSLSRI